VDGHIARAAWPVSLLIWHISALTLITRRYSSM
jgi:hypothetical protein